MQRFILILVLLFGNVYAQNLVPNSSFDAIYVKQKDRVSEMSMNYRVPEWNLSYISDFINLDNQWEDWVHSRMFYKGYYFKLKAAKGRSFMSLAILKTGDFRGYPSAKLIDPLEKDSFYKVSFQLAFLKESTFTTKSIEVLLTDSLIDFYKNERIPKADEKLVSPYIKQMISFSKSNNVWIKDTTWIKMQNIYEAKGGEQFITFGNFMSNENTIKNCLVKKSIGEIDTFCYFFIDDFKIEQIVIPSNFSDFDLKNIQKNQILVLKNVQFRNNESVLLPISKPELDKLANFLIKNNTITIEVSGHTDNIGSETDNQRLSEARAKAVYDYLVAKKISASRIIFKGCGSNRPVADNSTVKGREKNRRVEFKILAK